MNSAIPIVRVRSVMKPEVDIVDGMETVRDALQRMKHPETRTLIVKKRDADDEYGVVMFRDIALRVIAPNLSPDRVNIYEIMSKPVVGVHPDMNVRYCIKLFERFGLSRAPVIEDGNIVGLISYSDIVLKGVPGPGSE